MCFWQEQAQAPGIRPFLCQIIVYGIAYNSRKRYLHRHGCLLLLHQYPFFFPVDGAECKAGDIASPQACKKEQEENGFVAGGESIILCRIPQEPDFILCKVSYVFPCFAQQREKAQYPPALWFLPFESGLKDSGYVLLVGTALLQRAVVWNEKRQDSIFCHFIQAPGSLLLHPV